MNWDALGSVGELVGAVAVVVSVVYLAIQLKTNTKTMRAGAAWDAEKLYIDLNDNAARDPQFCELVQRATAADGDISDLDNTERVQIYLAILAAVQATQAQYFMWREGNLLEEVWSYRVKWFRDWTMLPVVRVNWEQIRSEQLVSPNFVNEIEREKGNKPPRIGLTN